MRLSIATGKVPFFVRRSFVTMYVIYDGQVEAFVLKWVMVVSLHLRFNFE